MSGSFLRMPEGPESVVAASLRAPAKIPSEIVIPGWSEGRATDAQSRICGSMLRIAPE